MTPTFSVVIPTHDRRPLLAEVLAALEAQQGAPPFEVVVVDDGCSDDTPELLAAWKPSHPFTTLRQDNQGPAVARNAGVAAAAGKWVAFLGDDTVPQRGWLAAHATAHGRRKDRQPLAVLGYTRWHSRVRRTAFLDHINEHGLQFGYALIEDPEAVPFNFFYTSNVSLPRQALLAEPMDPSFPDAAWEDTEVSYRLQRRGVTLVYEPAAVVEHDHPLDYSRFARRQQRAGHSAVVFYRLHPELGPFLGIGPQGPPPLPPAGRQRLREALVRALQCLPVKLPKTWDEALRYHYILGLRQGWEEHTPSPVPEGGPR